MGNDKSLKRSGVITRKDIEDAEKSVEGMMNTLQGKSNEVANELFEELEIDKMTLEALKDLAGNNDLKRECINAVQEKRRRFNATLEGKVVELETVIADYSKKLEQVDDKAAKKILEELQHLSDRAKDLKGKKSDLALINDLESQFNMPRSRADSLLKKSSQGVQKSGSNQQKYDEKVVIIEYYLKSILQAYRSQGLVDSDKKMLAYNQLKANYYKLKKSHKREEPLNKFEALEEGLKLMIQDIRGPGILKMQSEKKLNRISAYKLTAEASQAFDALSTLANPQRLAIDRDSLYLLKKINIIRQCLQNKTMGQNEERGDVKTALDQLKELESRIIRAKGAIFLFKKIAQNKVLKQMETMVNEQRGVFENAISNRDAPISSPVQSRKK